jgi:hypothetical protein
MRASWIAKRRYFSISASLFIILCNLQIGWYNTLSDEKYKKDKNDVLLIALFYLHYHHSRCHCNGLCARKRSTRINYFLVLVSNTKVERRTEYEILVLYILNIPNLKLLSVYILENYWPIYFCVEMLLVLCNEHGPSFEAK